MQRYHSHLLFPQSVYYMHPYPNSYQYSLSPTGYGFGYDEYQIVLTKAPKLGETVTVNLIAEPTRTQRGAGLYGIRAFTPEVELWHWNGMSYDQKLEFTTANWFDSEYVLVTAVADDRVDGGDSKSFATQLDLANNIEGPLEITGGMTEDRSADLEREPLMLLGETNFKPEIGSVVEADSFNITIDLDERVDGTAVIDTVTQGGSAGVMKVVTNTNGRTSPTNANEVQLLTIDAVSGHFILWLDVSEDGLIDLTPNKELVWGINYDPDDPKQVALDIKNGLNALDDITVAQVLASESAFLIEFDILGYPDLPELVPFPSLLLTPVTKVGVFVDGWVDLPDKTPIDTHIVQDLAIYGNAGSFSLWVAGVPAMISSFDPSNENQSQEIQNAIQAAVDTAYGIDEITVTVNGSSSNYQVVFDNPNGHNISDMVVNTEDLSLNEIQTLAINASEGTFMLKYQNDINKTGPLDWNIDPADLKEAVEGLTDITDVSVEVSIDPIRAERIYTITFLDPGDTGVDQLEVMQNVSGQLDYFTLGRTVKETIETKLVLDEELVAPEQLFDYTLEIVKNDAKNKVRLITDGTSEIRNVDGYDHTFFVLEVDRPWEGGLTREIPDSDSLFTLEETNPNLLVDENEETDILYLNDGDSVVSYYNDTDGDGISDVTLKAGKLTITADRLTGLGMAPDPQYVGGELVEGGVKYVGLEEMYIDLGTGDNVVEIMETHSGATIINAGRGEDFFDIRTVSGHTYVNAGPDADSIIVTDSSLVEGVNALLTITGDVPQVQVLTLGKGSPPDFAVNVEAADEIQQFTVDATGGSFSLGFTNPADLTDTEFTTMLDWDAAATEVQSAFEALEAIKPGDILVEKFGSIYRVSFMGDLGARDIPLLSVNDLGLSSQGPIDKLLVDDSAETDDGLALLTSSSLTGLGMTSVNEVQTLRIDATGGTFRIHYAGGASIETVADGGTGQNEVQALTIDANGGTFILGYDDGGTLKIAP